MVEIISEKCVGCGLCTRDCLTGNLSVVEGKAVAGNTCIGCGHCFAVCPNKAVQIPDYPTEGIIEYDELCPSISGEELLNFIKSRRSIRNYQKKVVERETWEKIFEAGRFTATAANSQDVKYTVVQDDLETVKKYVWAGMKIISEAMRKTQVEDSPFIRQLESMIGLHERNPEHDPLFFNAPALLIITSASSLNGGLATSNIELMAHAEGLGVLISGFIQMALSKNEAACKYLNVDAKSICSCLLVGYPAVEYQRSVQRKAANIEWK